MLKRKILEEYNITEHEIKILKALRAFRGFNWLTRDKDGRLYAFVNKPRKLSKIWVTDFDKVTHVNEGLFAFIKWEDDEPTSIQELLK